MCPDMSKHCSPLERTHHFSSRYGKKKITGKKKKKKIETDWKLNAITQRDNFEHSRTRGAKSTLAKFRAFSFHPLNSRF